MDLSLLSVESATRNGCQKANTGRVQVIVTPIRDIASCLGISSGSRSLCLLVDQYGSHTGPVGSTATAQTPNARVILFPKHEFISGTYLRLLSPYVRVLDSA